MAKKIFSGGPRPKRRTFKPSKNPPPSRRKTEEELERLRQKGRKWKPFQYLPYY